MKKVSPRILLIVCFIFIFIITALVNNKQNFQSKSATTTTVSFVPESSWENPIVKHIGDPIMLDIMVDPGINHVSIVKLNIQYPPSHFRLLNKDTIVVNKNAFSTIIEGPVIKESTGNIYLTLSVGIDPNQAIKTPTKIGTLKLIATQETGRNYSSILFSTKTQVYSVSPNDHAYANVISTATPAYIHILAPNTPTPSPTAILTKLFPTTQTIFISSGSSQSSSPIPSNESQKPTPTPLPNATVLALSAQLQNINENPERKFAVTLYNKADEKIARAVGKLLYEPSNKSYTGTIIVEDALPEGDYIVKLSTDSYLEKRIPGIHFISQGRKLTLPHVALTPGDINGDNIIDILDYSQILTCFSSPEQLCTPKEKSLSDLNEDGTVNDADYLLFVKEVPLQPAE